MAKRRCNHEGTIFKRKNGSWRAQVSIHGRRLSFSGKTQKECQDWLKETIRQMDEGYSYSSTQVTLRQFMKNWLVSIEPSRAPSTFQLYRSTVENEIIPRIGNIKLKDLRPDHIQSLYDLRIAEGGTPYTIKRIHKVLHCALEHGVKLGLLVRNPAHVVTIPKLERKEMRFYTDEQVQQFLSTAKETQDRLYTLYYLAIHTGMRKSELLGLRWQDIDGEKGTLQVKYQLVWKKGGRYELTAPKTRSSKRSMILGQGAIDVLKEHQVLQQLEQAYYGSDWEDHGLVFPSMTGKPMRGHTVSVAFEQVASKAKLPKIRFHDLRHTAATMMLNFGIPAIIVSKRLGHARASITLDVYGHLIPSKQEEAAALMDRLMSPKIQAGCTEFAPGD